MYPRGQAQGEKSTFSHPHPGLGPRRLHGLHLMLPRPPGSSWIHQWNRSDREIYYPSCEGSPGLAVSLKEGHSACAARLPAYLSPLRF